MVFRVEPGIRIVALLWAASLVMPSTARAQPVLTWQGGAGFSAAFYQMETLARQDLDAFSFGVQLDLTPRFYQVFALRTDVGLGFFGPICLDETADCSASKTSVMSLSGALATGIYAPELRLGGRREFLYLSPALFAGREWITAWRGEAQCLNCIDGQVQLDGGFFLEPGLDVSFSRDVGVGAFYRLYEGASDLRGRLTVRFFVRGPVPQR